MNRQQFLVELYQYLTFFSPEEKTRIISAYNEKFDSAGPDCEAALLAEFGTPMMAAIDLKRRMESGEKMTFGEESPCEEKPDEFASEYSVETETEETLNNENSEASEDPVEDVKPEEPSSAPELTVPPEKPKPRGAKFVFAIMGASLISLVIAAFFLVIGAIGAGLLVSTCYLLIAGLKSLVYLTDALLLFGGGLVLAGLGLIIVWFAVWSAISLISKLFRNACGAGSTDSDKE
ncbi:MAG: hypothetical protein CVU91_05110 [Firmicutes bacterium HGW-Firmicutes-16]|nr:MAG: hypothetical protein CVU91_05110 [Firmicutes bacterium HGW-Firmicutes-16]